MENIPTQHRVVLLPSGKPMLKFIKGGIVIHSGKPCLIVEVDIHLTTKQKTDGFVNISLKEIGSPAKFVPKWKNLETQGADNTPYKALKKGTKLTVKTKYFIQPYQMIVTEDVKAPNITGYSRILVQQRVFAADGPTIEGASTEILTLSLDGLLDNPKDNKILTGREETKRKRVHTNGWRPPNGCTTGSHTNPNPKPNPKPNPLANPTSFYAYGYVHIK